MYKFELYGSGNGVVHALPVKVVGICEFQGSLIVATERSVYRMDGDRLVPIPFIVHEQQVRNEDSFAYCAAGARGD